jgi:hypothetical protein
MRKSNGSIDWEATATRARGMMFRELWGAILDIRKTLPYADANDRVSGKDDGGYYRDCASVYHAEVRWRFEHGGPSLPTDRSY